MENLSNKSSYAKVNLGILLEEVLILTVEREQSV